MARTAFAISHGVPETSNCACTHFRVARLFFSISRAAFSISHGIPEPSCSVLHSLAAATSSGSCCVVYHQPPSGLRGGSCVYSCLNL
eukprot:1764231-Rhodomonas_salina.1